MGLYIFRKICHSLFTGNIRYYFLNLLKCFIHHIIEDKKAYVLYESD